MHATPFFLRRAFPLFAFLVAAAAVAASPPPRAPVPPPSPAPSVAPSPAPPPSLSVLVVKNGVESLLAPADADRAGYTRVSLRESWTPFIFTEPLDANLQPLPNRYRSVFLGLAQGRTDGDGQPLPAGAPSYLELYGIPPTFGLLRARFLADASSPACKDVDYAAIRAVPSVPSREPKNEVKERARLDSLARELESRRKKAGASDLAALGARVPSLSEQIKTVERARANRIAFPEVEKRLRCEGMLVGRARHASGFFDEAMREAVVRFQQRNKLYDAAALKPETMAALGKTPLENDYDALVRALTERVVSAGNLLEDGSTDGKDGPRTYKNVDGTDIKMPNRVAAGVKAALDQLGLGSADAALAFFKRHPAGDFEWLEAGIMLAAPPPWESAGMDLSVEIDRGDVVYDPLYNAAGKETNQSRHRFPSFTLRVKWQGQTIPLVRWRTTIGGWRSDLAADGYEYFRYKGSDVGPRVWRNIVSGPVWIIPPSTPIRTMVKDKTVNGSSQTVVNYDETGPGYLSAYGLVAAYNVVPGKDGKPDWDNGVRVHGSAEYLSILNPNAFSHGCHRLMNHLAVRLFSYVLRHRNVKIIGERPLGYTRQFLWKDDVYELRLPSRGFHWELDPPLPLNVLEGSIIGTARKPILSYMPKPGVIYPPGPPPIPPDSPEARAGGSAE